MSFQTAISQPTIYVTEADHERLSALVGSSSTGPAGVALLREELDRAVLVGPGDRPPTFAKLGSTVRFQDRATRKTRTVQLVLPDAADIDLDRISVLTPVGAALLGMSPGQDFIWEAESGRLRTLRILAVKNPRADA